MNVKKSKLYKAIYFLTGIIMMVSFFVVLTTSVMQKNIYGSYNSSTDNSGNISNNISSNISNNTNGNISSDNIHNIINELNIKEKANPDNNKYSNQSEKTATSHKSLYKNKTDILVLVNKYNKIPDNYKAELRKICNGRLQASGVIYDDLADMLEAAGKEGYSYWIASAYRSREKQQKLVDEDVAEYMKQGMSYNEALKRTYKQTMPAGYSEHETGLALDILCSNNIVMDISQEYEPGNQWLRENSYKYGFVLRYPENKEDITKINYEPWHFRYVGKKMAKKMYKEDITLEELQEKTREK